jgi:CheY-like chemotaxis protein/Tfp pilus assembly protein PilZ
VRGEAVRKMPDLHLTVEYPDIKAFLHDYRENIQRGGTFILSPRQWVVGEPLRLTMSFPGLIKPIRLSGRVSWARIGKEPGVGVDFLFDESPERALKLKQKVAAIERGDPAYMARVIRILIAEDNTMIFDMIQEGLDRLVNRRDKVRAVFNCQIATDGSTARNIIENHPIDMLIVDVNLPVLDGDTLIQMCKDLLGPQFPVIAVSGGGKETSSRALQAGADLYLAKPLRLMDIYNSIVDLLELSEPLP